MAISDSDLRSRITWALISPAMNGLYRIPRIRQAALIRMIHSRRNCRFRTRRSR
jgi:hypothetical protein